MKNTPKNRSELLSFPLGNAKIEGIWTFSLPAGWTCPGARECLAKVPRDGGPIVNGPDNVFRCFSASMESFFPNVRNTRWGNLDKLNASKDMMTLIYQSLPGVNGDIYRIHVSGDFFSDDYFMAWIKVAKLLPFRTFYAYTKSLDKWLKYKKNIPKNFILTASKGGKFDDLIKPNRLKSAEVVFTVEEAKRKKLEIDHDDSHAYNGKKSFALLLHGKQKAGTKAAEALKLLKRNGLGTYKRTK